MAFMPIFPPVRITGRRYGAAPKTGARRNSGGCTDVIEVAGGGFSADTGMRWGAMDGSGLRRLGRDAGARRRAARKATPVGLFRPGSGLSFAPSTAVRSDKQRSGAEVSASSDERRALLLANPKSGSGRAALGDIIELLQERGMIITSAAPKSPEQIPDLIRTNASQADMVIVGGGDGTLSGCLPTLIECDLPLGILPMGTANDLARTLGIPADPSEAAAIIAEGHSARIDVGFVNDRPFFNVASIGFSAEVAKFHRGERKKLLRLLSYPLSWADAYRSHRHFHATITCDGKPRQVRCAMAAVGNGRYYGGGMTIAEDARIDDGLLHVSYVRPIGAWGLLRLLPSLRSGTLAKHELAEVWHAKEVEIATRRPKRINVDGELIGRTPAVFSIRPKLIEVLVPRSGAAGPD